MCGRYTLSTPAPELADLFGADWDELDVPEPRFNVAPTDDVLVVRPRSGGRELTALRWGLIPGWAEARSGLPLMINARVETLEVKRAFRDLIPSGRCAIVADGFYEWR
ncbi:MAG: SOS response-associated peptidase, partial [Gemmatimonadetes bacterium]|nr:SOS response-associated peptidase [Gemmatimonadota bacterium]